MMNRHGAWLAAALLLAACGGPAAPIKEGSTPVSETKSENPLLAEFDTPFGVPPFEEIENAHYVPAFEEAMRVHNDEIRGIVESDEPATFDNTVVALDMSGSLLTRVARVFFPMNSANTDDEIQTIAKEIAPKLSAHEDAIAMNPALFDRVKRVYDDRADLDLDLEQARLLDETYKGFVRGGALLDDEGKARMAKINERLSVLSVQFGENLLGENNEFKLVIDKEADLAGLPQSSIDSAAAAAKKAGMDGKWVFTLHKPSWIPFLQFSGRRDLREKMFKGYADRGDNGDERDNKAILVEMAKLRLERAKLLGFESHAAYVLAENMAKTPAKVMELLDKLWAAAMPKTKAERDELQKLIDAEKGGFELQPWDWWYYTEKLRKAKYSLSDEELKPYFELSNVQKGVFDVASKLYGLQFEQRTDIPIYHPDAKTFEVRDADGNHVGIVYVDYYTRESKRQGAWMTAYRGQEYRDGEMVHPVIANVFNFPPPAGGKPSLLTLEEVTTVFHEFGHGLHGLLSNVHYPSLAGTSVPRDFVELPSQVMENWATEPEVLKSYALHFETGEPIPDELIEKIVKSRHFNQGFETTEYLAASLLDMKWHTLTEDPGDVDPDKFEDDYLNEMGLIPEIISRYRSTYFAHIFAGGYSSGYYSYIWSAVLDSDAFAAFKETGDLFDPKTAKSFRDNILSIGNSRDLMEQYKKFRGKDPSIDPLLEKRGLK